MVYGLASQVAGMLGVESLVDDNGELVRPQVALGSLLGMMVVGVVWEPKV